MVKHLTAPCAFFLSLLLLAPGCTRKSEAPFDPGPPLRVQLSAEPVSLDPALAEDGLSIHILANIMDGLVGYDGSGKLQPRLAQSWQVSPDGKRYDFTLRSGALWSDGAPVVARHFVDGIRRSLDPAMGSKLAAMLAPLKEAREENGHVILELKGPAPYFLQALTLTAALPIRKDWLDSHQGKWSESAPVTGAFKITQHQQGQKITLERNPKYWNAPSPLPRGAIEKVELVVVNDDSTAVSLFEKGKLDILIRVPSLDFARFKERGLIHIDPFLATYYLAFNTRKPPFRDRAWRQAVSGSISRSEITGLLESGEEPARSWIPPGLEGHIPYTDPRNAFRDAAVAARKSGPSSHQVTAGFDSSSRNQMILEKVQADLLRQLGIRIALSNLDWKSYIQQLQTDPPEIYRFGWMAPFADPLPHLQVFTTRNPNNYTGWSSPEYDRLVDEVAALQPGPEREQKIRAAQALLVDREAVVVPIYHYVQTHALSERISGFKVNPFGAIRFDELSLQEVPHEQ